jgi:hypothetical protein
MLRSLVAVPLPVVCPPVHALLASSAPPSPLSALRVLLVDPTPSNAPTLETSHCAPIIIGNSAHCCCWHSFPLRHHRSQHCCQSTCTSTPAALHVHSTCNTPSSPLPDGAEHWTVRCSYLLLVSWLADPLPPAARCRPICPSMSGSIRTCRRRRWTSSLLTS